MAWVTHEVRFGGVAAGWSAVIDHEGLAAYRCDGLLIQSERGEDGAPTGRFRQVLALVARTTGEIVPLDEVPGFRWCHPSGPDVALKSYQDYLALAPLLEAEALIRAISGRPAPG